MALDIMGMDGGVHELDDATIENFRGSLRGVCLGADDEGYDIARQVWNKIKPLL